MDDKLSVLITLYKQQQSTAHILRERMSKIVAATISLLIGIDGWVFTKADRFGTWHSVLLVASILILLGVAIYALKSRYNEFCAVAKLIVRIETAMKIYERGHFLEDESLYPESFQKLGEKDYEYGANIFRSYSAMLLVVGGLSVGIVLLA